MEAVMMMWLDSPLESADGGRKLQPAKPAAPRIEIEHSQQRATIAIAHSELDQAPRRNGRSLLLYGLLPALRPSRGLRSVESEHDLNRCFNLDGLAVH